MRKAIFLVIISLALQGFSQDLNNGIYLSNECNIYTWEDGKIVKGTKMDDGQTYIHVTDLGFRVFMGPGQTGETFPSIYMGKDSDGYDIWGTYPDDRTEYRNNTLIMFYNFDVEQGYYTKSMELSGMNYLRENPNLEYEE
tara:strand:- start:631 stop:1050 length:420 start_codon:yes stop_codon:yes gene_type:complete